MAQTKLEVAIESGASLSDDVEINGNLVGLVVPENWTAASMTFQAAFLPTDTFEDVYDDALGTALERTIDGANIPASGGRFLALSLNDWLGLRRLKIRSGTSAAPVNQGGRRVITLIISG